MTYIIAEPCIDIKDRSCVDVCPVDCIHEYGRILVIDPIECIDCGACEPECPNNAIYEGAQEWRFSDGTGLSGMVKPKSGGEYDADEAQEPVDYDVFYIVTDKCTECVGFHEEPQCAAVCPVDCCIPDENNVENESELLEKQKFMHI